MPSGTWKPKLCSRRTGASTSTNGTRSAAITPITTWAAARRCCASAGPSANRCSISAAKSEFVHSPWSLVHSHFLQSAPSAQTPRSPSGSRLITSSFPVADLTEKPRCRMPRDSRCDCVHGGSRRTRGDGSMIVCRRRTALIALVLSVAAFGLHHRARAEDSPVGRIIAQVIPIHNSIHPSDQIVGMMKLRAGRPFDDALLQEDMQALHATHWFQPGSIKPSVSVGPDGQVTIVISVSELISTVHEIVYLGAQHISPKELGTLTQIHKGDPLEPSLNEQGRKAILRKYQEEQGRWFATVELLEGNKPHDTRVVYRITEGKVVKVRGISFSGNLDAQAGRLKEQLVTKRQFLGIFGGKFNQLTIDTDMAHIKEYYARLGFLNVRVDPEIHHSPDFSHVHIVYHIDEGVRSTVSSIDVVNSQLYSNEKLKAVTALQPGQRYD